MFKSVKSFAYESNTLPAELSCQPGCTSITFKIVSDHRHSDVGWGEFTEMFFIYVVVILKEFFRTISPRVTIHATVKLLSILVCTSGKGRYEVMLKFLVLKFALELVTNTKVFYHLQVKSKHH